MDLVHDDGQQAEEEEDPLDAYMRSIEGEVVHQQASTINSTTTTTINTTNPRIHPQQQHLVPPTGTSLLPLGLEEHNNNSNSNNSAATAAVFKQPRHPPSAAQLAVAHKVAASRFCDVFTRRRRRGIRAPRIHSRYDVDVDDRNHDDTNHVEERGEVEEVCLDLLLAQPAEFLR